MIGLGIALISVIGSIFHLHQSLATYFDVVALFVVLGGTLSVAVITMPWDYYPVILRAIRSLFRPQRHDPKLVLSEALRLVRTGEANPASFLSPGLAGEILRDGSEMIALGFQPDKIESILSERIHQEHERLLHVGNSVRALAKYPPAFGLMGTVLGLVSLMRALSDSAGSKETGMRMAVALVATLYGLLTSNLLLNPAGEHILKHALEEKKDAELALQGVLLAAERTPLLEAHEMLNSFVQKKDRVSFGVGATESADTESPQETTEEAA